MPWKFDQAQNVACITCQSVVDGSPVLLVTHYEDDHSWAFLDGLTFNPKRALVVAMSEVIDQHRYLQEIATLAPGWTATRSSLVAPWTFQQDQRDVEEL